MIGGFTEFICQPTTDNHAVKSWLEAKKYRPSWFLPTPWLKILFRKLTSKKRAISFRTYDVEVGESDKVTLATPDREFKKESSLIVIIPDLADDHTAWYVVDAVATISQVDWRPLVVCMAAGDKAMPSAKNMFRWHRFADLEAILQYLKREADQIMLMGFGLGATLVQRYLSEQGSKGRDPIVKGGVAISPVLSADLTYLKIDGSFLLRRAFLNPRKERLLGWFKDRTSRERLENLGINEAAVKQVNYNTEFDFRVICKTTNNRFLDDYYKLISDSSRLAGVNCRLLTIISRLDPMTE